MTLGWMIVRTLTSNRRGRSEGHFPPTLLSSEMDPSTDGTDTGTDAPGDSGPGSCGAVGFTGAFPGPRRRRLNNNRKAG